MKSLFVFAAATAAVLTSAAFATPGPGSDRLHRVHAEGRLTALTDDQAMMCQVLEAPRDHAASPHSGSALRLHPGA